MSTVDSLGNAVVPQVAEAVGYVVRELLEREQWPARLDALVEEAGMRAHVAPRTTDA